MLCGIKMEFEEIYFEGEIREGFYIQPLMKRAWAAQLEVLHEIDVICKKHKIKYFAEWGTLLGAVRHKGFIPWDDDIDIGMLREDYEKFLHYAKKELTGSSYVLDINNAYFDELMARVMNTDKITFDSEFLDKYHGCPYGIGVDIFCLDHIPKNKEEEQILLTLLAATDCLGKQWDSDEISEEEKWDNVRLIEELTGVHFNNDVPVKKQLIQLADKISAMYWDAESDEVSLLFLTASKPDYRLPLSCYEKTIEVPFENTVIPIPVGYDEVLKLRYGKDYMTPVKVWHTHDYPFFKVQIQMLREFYQANGLEMPECYDMECR